MIMDEYLLNVPEYLARIGIREPVCADEASLIRLTRAHLEAVPFENLEICCQRREPSLEPRDLYMKIVVGRRGGYCFELNKLFFLLLKELGFQCRSIPARVVHHRTEPRPISHRAILVALGDETWLCDVGFGGAGPKGAIRMNISEPQCIFGEEFSVSIDHGIYAGEYVLSRREEGRWELVLVLKDEPWLEADFNTLNSYYATYPRSPFLLKRVLYRCTPDGWISLVGNTFTAVAGTNRQIVELQAEQQLQEIIEHRFGLCLKQSTAPTLPLSNTL